MNNKTKFFGGLLAAAVIVGFGFSTVEAHEPHHRREKKEIRWERVILDLLTPGHHRDEYRHPAPPPPQRDFRPAPPPAQRDHRPAPPPRGRR